MGYTKDEIPYLGPLHTVSLLWLAPLWRVLRPPDSSHNFGPRSAYSQFPGKGVKLSPPRILLLRHSPWHFYAPVKEYKMFIKKKSVMFVKGKLHIQSVIITKVP